MKKFVLTYTIAIKSDGMDEIEAKNKTSATRKLDKKIYNIMKNGQIESIALNNNCDLEIDSNIEEIVE